MFRHNFCYELKTALRSKDLIIWLILFPVALGLFFKVAFDGLYDSETRFSAVETAVVDEADDKMFRGVAESVSGGDDPLLDITYTDREKALELLRNGDVYGVIFTGEELTLMVAEDGIRSAILKTFVDDYNLRSRVVRNVAGKDPGAVPAAMEAMSRDINAVNEIPLTDGDTDNLIQYFYNLIAMVAMFGSVLGLNIAKVNQANISALGARKCCSPTPKLIAVLASLMANFLIQSCCMVFSVSYIQFILNINFGRRLLLVYVSAILGGMVGVAIGFCVGSIGRLSEKAKNAVIVAVSMLLCHMSGLMFADMKALMQRKAPWFNKINPPAVISDCFYCLNIYKDYDRFTGKLITMVLLIAVFTLIGFLFTRRKKYASL